MRNLRVPVMCAVAIMSACHRDRDSDAVVAAAAAPRIPVPAAVTRGPTAAQQTVGMVEAATLGKSTVPVLLKFDLQQKPQTGLPMEIILAILPQVNASPVEIEVSGSEGLDLSDAAKLSVIPSVEAGGVYRQTVKVVPNSAGVLLLGLTVALKHDEITEFRTFSVPLIVDR